MNFEKAKEELIKYIKTFDLKNVKVKLKFEHTFGVVEISEKISRSLNLDDENIELGKIIALLHDIGRFEQIKQFDSFSDRNTIDHSILGVQILFKDNMIRKFIKTDKYDNIIKTAILNHNKYEIEEGLSENELIHSKLIRDADKMDIFRIRINKEYKTIFNTQLDEIENSLISYEVYKDLLDNKSILISKTHTYIDKILIIIGFIFDFNFPYGLKYIKENNLINKLLDKNNYKNKDTIKKINVIKEHLHTYLENTI